MQENRIKSRYLIVNYVIISLLLVLSMYKPLYAQSVINSKISFAANNEKLSIVLVRLANEANLNFTYDAGDIVFAKVFTYNAVDKLPLVILDELLSNTGHTYRQVGNQIVIYKNSTVLNNDLIVDTAPDSVLTIIDSIYYSTVADTIYIRDTIITIVNDTVRIIDTVFAEKQIFQKSDEDLRDITSTSFVPITSREKGWSASIFIAPIVSNFALAHEEGNITFRNFSLGIEANRIIHRWNISAGIKLTQFSEKFNHSYTVNEGGFFVTDTVDSYYTVIQNDTAWYYITDSTWKPIDSHEYNYNINNRVGYIEFAASVSFDYFSNNEIELYAKTGMQAGVLVYKNGLAIPDKSNPEGVEFASLNFRPTSYSILFGTGIRYQINEYLDFNSEIYYLNYFTDMIDDYPNFTKVRGAGIRFGLIYYF